MLLSMIYLAILLVVSRMFDGAIDIVTYKYHQIRYYVPSAEWRNITYRVSIASRGKWSFQDTRNCAQILIR